MLEDKSLAPRLSLVVATEGEDQYVAAVSTQISLSPVGSSDEQFLYQTFASTRAAEMALTGWNTEQQETFLRMQYQAQRSWYRVQCPDAEYWVICCGETAVGRLIIDRTPEQIHVVDIALLPEFRKQGIGSTLMKAIMKEAAQAAKAVGLYVERFNPALSWYERLGFRVAGSGPIYFEMVWRAAQASGGRDQPAAGSHVPEPSVGAAYADSSD